MGLKRKAIRNIGVITVTQISGRVIRILTTIILARLLLPYDFGIVAIGLLIVEFLQQFKDFGIGAAVIQKKDQIEEALNTALTLRIILSVILFLIAILFAPVMAMFFEEPSVTDIARVVAIVIIIGSVSFAPEIMLVKDIMFKKIGAIEVLRAVTYSVISISLALNGFSYWSLVYGALFSQLFSAIALWIIAPLRIKISFNKKVAKEIFNFGKFVFGANLVVFAIMNVDNALIGKVLSISVLGYYVLAYRWGLWSTYLTQIISRVTFPTYAKIQEQIKKLRYGYLKTAEYVGFMSFPLAFGLSAVASIFIPVIVGTKWNPAVPALEILCIFGVFEILIMIAAQILLAVGKPSITFKASVVRFVIIIAFIYPVMKWQDILGVAILVTIATFVQAFLMNIEVCKITDTSLLSLIQSIAPSMICSLLLFIVIFLCKLLLPATLLVLLALVGLGVIIYVTSLYLITKGEIIIKIKEITGAFKSK